MRLFIKDKILRSRSEFMAEGWSNCYETSADVNIGGFLSKRWYRLVFSLLELANVSFPANRFLEVGCGKGLFCVFASMNGAEAVGIDAAKPALKKADRTGQGLFFVADACTLPFMQNQFDVVVCADVLEHISCYEQAFAQMARVCKKGGYLIFTTPSRTNITEIFMPFFLLRRRFHIGENQPTDVNSFSFSKLKMLCKQNNLKVLFERGIGMVWLPTSNSRITKVLSRMERPRTLLKSLCINIGVIAQKI